MSKNKKLLGILSGVMVVAVLAGIWYWQRDTPEKRIRQVISRLEVIGSKTPHENPAIAALKMRNIDEIFASPTKLELGLPSFNGNLSPKEIAGHILRFKSICSEIQVAASDIVITFPAPDQATAEFSGSCSALDQQKNDSLEEIRDVTLNLRYDTADKKWRIHRAEFHQVVEK